MACSHVKRSMVKKWLGYLPHLPAGLAKEHEAAVTLDLCGCWLSSEWVTTTVVTKLGADHEKNTSRKESELGSRGSRSLVRRSPERGEE